MLLNEANGRLKTPITEKQLWDIHNLYCILDLSKDDFCKIVDAVGVETIIAQKTEYDSLFHRKNYLRNMKRFPDIYPQEELRLQREALQAVSNALLESMQMDETTEGTTLCY